ncbi:hypothetical protein QPM17_03720 [Marinobacter sp. TBZ242]|uniref:Uncharacterized protein n=1 Tax=Marinobacter azerbaijanicus TaxID=3050455 RepID=A0ABT7I7U5_9GAMM|nr:hypothetical protein [Marinobacter sp. TBZ242]MDL0430217.1 hypothetical protein [Marinobacter sp. TBZ242]
MTSEEFAERFQKHPLGHCFQAMEITDTVFKLENTAVMAKGMLLLLEFQGEITKEEYEFLIRASQGNAQRNKKRIEKTSSAGTQTKQ